MENRRAINYAYLNAGENVITVSRGSYQFLRVDYFNNHKMMWYEEGINPIGYKDVVVELVQENDYVPLMKETGKPAEFYGTILTPTKAWFVYRTQ